MDAEIFKRGMRHCASSVMIVAVGVEPSSRTGMTATSICSLSDSPATLIACINRNASAHALIRSEGCFSVNLLGVQHRYLAERFAGRHGLLGAERFDAKDWTTLETGAPILSSAIAVFDCILLSEHECGTHSIFIGAVTGSSAHVEGVPLIYSQGQFSTILPIAESVSQPA